MKGGYELPKQLRADSMLGFSVHGSHCSCGEQELAADG